MTGASLVVATGGLSIPRMGATGFGYALARQFGHTVLPTRAGLVPLTFSGTHLDHLRGPCRRVAAGRERAAPASVSGADCWLRTGA